MEKKTTVAIAHSDKDLGKPAECTREQLDLVKSMIRDIADQTMGGMRNIVTRGDKVLIKINTVIPIAPNAGFDASTANDGRVAAAWNAAASLASADIAAEFAVS